MPDMVRKPAHYASDGMETIDVVEAVIEGLPAGKALSLAHVLRYSMRAGKKTKDASEDLAKANNYAFRLVTGKWRHQTEGPFKVSAEEMVSGDGEPDVMFVCPRCDYNMEAYAEAFGRYPLHCPTCALPISEDGEEYIGEGNVS